MEKAKVITFCKNCSNKLRPSLNNGAICEITRVTNRMDYITGSYKIEKIRFYLTNLRDNTHFDNLYFPNKLGDCSYYKPSIFGKIKEYLGLIEYQK